MAYQSTFKRHEIKYLMDQAQKADILAAMEPHMKLDSYGRSSVRSIYYDTDSWRLIRRSLEKPVYKEKLRVRSYGQAGPRDRVFVEIKKKYKKVVYKRRIALPLDQVEDCFRRGTRLPAASQISDEIEYFRGYYKGLRPAVFLSYEREAFYALDGSDFRVTFDEDILYRDYDLSLADGVYGVPLLKPGQTLMEVKTAGGMPLWMSSELNRLGLFKESFSKYGLAYRDIMAGGSRKAGAKYDGNNERRILNAG